MPINAKLIAKGLLLEQFRKISYVPKLNQITGSVASTIFLMQCFYWHEKSKGVFYKYTAPCAAEDYREGDSWTEELCMSREEFETARSRVAVKTTIKDKDEALKTSMVVYWVDMSRKTWYAFNEDLFLDHVIAIFEGQPIKKPVAQEVKPQRPPRQPRKAAEPSKPKKQTDPRVSQVMTAFYELLPEPEHASLNYGKEGRGAKALLRFADHETIKWNVEELITKMRLCYADMKKEKFYAGKHVGLQEIHNRIGAWWEERRHKEPRAKSNGDGLQPDQRSFWVIGRRYKDGAWDCVCEEGRDGLQYRDVNTGKVHIGQADIDAYLKQRGLNWRD